MNTAMIDAATDSETRAAQKAQKQRDAAEQLAAEKQKQRDAAEQLYWDILCDPRRTTAADKTAFEGARQTLGKTTEDVRDDVELIAKINTADQARAECVTAQEALIRLHEEWEQWTSGGAASGRNKAVAAVHDKTKSLEKAKEEAGGLLGDWQREASYRDKCRAANPQVVRRLNAGK